MDLKIDKNGFEALPKQLIDLHLVGASQITSADFALLSQFENLEHLRLEQCAIDVRANDFFPASLKGLTVEKCDGLDEETKKAWATRFKPCRELP